MDKLYFRTLSKAVDHYREAGYTFPFVFTGGRPTSPEPWAIVEIHRFEGDTDPADNAVLFVLKHRNGKDKGLIINAYGSSSDKKTDYFLTRVARSFPDWLVLPN